MPNEARAVCLTLFAVFALAALVVLVWYHLSGRSAARREAGERRACQGQRKV